MAQPFTLPRAFSAGQRRAACFRKLPRRSDFPAADRAQWGASGWGKSRKTDACRLRSQRPWRFPLFLTAKTRYSVAMADKFICMVCDVDEGRCQCEKYCNLCHGLHNVRLCQDGMYYCLDCREACELQAQY